ncbi:hypothetical protein WR25_11209 isoform D [Diploscapter pachys]|uniref:SSD domain-containing protein n=1 Tax=Diploscapter pachys TaxID=2018661 RepID=A0A2A2LUP6_9BILA|nr:hypothetical protein WR25_11209 isoform A [Diploscapter pachys]PAV89736.1 hypothetical protein WR25_11209 isoform B [Diploscapter pachys]PAV89737.1 hypothetical protein WR25_11209 isoform C [Diploscapter pachys]PAV89738.1 hypothetical protein WR25_11209 isoform D [Diploscapter pachys]
MSRYPHMKEVIEIMDIVGSNLTHKNQSFYTMCSDFCMINEPIRQFYNGLTLRGTDKNETGENQRISLTFPIMEVLGKELDLSPNFFGVRTNESDHSLEYLKIVVMQFRANPPLGWVKEDVAEYERMLSTYFHKVHKSNLLNTYALSLTYTGDEIVRTGLTIFPYIAVGFTIMSIFSIVTVYYSSTKMHQLSIHKLVLALFGCVCPLLATSSALGLLFWFGFRFSTILAVTPFLILAIGVDDAFLMINSWMRITNKDRSMTKRDRIAWILVDVGPSVAITSLTNFLAFIVGIYTPTPEIQLFCAGNAVAILFDFFYQITMYAALMSITGNYDMRNEHKTKDVKWDPLENETYIRLLDDYSQWLASKFTAILLAISVFVYLLVSIKGAMQIQIKLTPDKLVLSDSPLIQMNHLRDQFVLPNYTTVNIFVQRPGNLSNPNQLLLTNKLIEEFEAIPECLGPKFSHYFVRDYQMYEKMADAEEELEEFEEEDANAHVPDKFSRQKMVSFLSWPEFQHWNGFVRFNENGTLNRFWATVSYHGEALGDFGVRKKFLLKWRSIADSYPSLNVSIFDDYAPFVDTLETILPATISTSLCTLICMMLVCFLFMYNVFTVIVATLAITSICIGIF